MTKIVAIEHLTLDGVYQAPARGDEDTRHSFKHGGWANAGDDPEMQGRIAKYMKGGWSLLVGRTTYEDLYEGWQVRQPSHPMTSALAGTQKFVVTHDETFKLPWTQSTLLAGDALETVARLKRAHDKTLVIFGSAVLVRALLQGGLVDEFVLMIHPLVLGEGRRFFDQGTAATKLTLVEQVTTKTGVIVASYQIASRQ